MAHIIVIGNEKGGSGKSTTAMHLATALARAGRRVGALDLDLRQRSFGRFLENRAAFAAARGLALPKPLYGPLPGLTPEAGDEEAERRLGEAVVELGEGADFLVIDCPGAHTRLSQLAHSMADTLVTPLNDSFVDFDVLARIDGGTGRILGPSIYSEMVWSARLLRAKAGLPPIDWVVLRNRMGAQRMHNKAKMGRALQELGRRIGFRAAGGVSERVIFRELFPRGLTLMDLRQTGVAKLNLSNAAALEELRALVAALRLPGPAPAI